MDKASWMNANTLFLERCGFHITKFRKENEKNKAVFEIIEIERKRLKELASNDLLRWLENYEELLSTYKDIESKYLYVQGIKDCIILYHFLDSDFINPNYEDLMADNEIPSVTEDQTMFQNSRYLTKGVQIDIPIETQMFMWELIDERIRKGAKLDYLQVFNLSIKKDSVGNYLQVIEHMQEVQKYKKRYSICVEKCLNEKIFVIDSEAYSTMLLASEY